MKAECRWCFAPARFTIGAQTPTGTVRAVYGACGAHVTRAVEYVTVPGGQARVVRVS